MNAIEQSKKRQINSKDTNNYEKPLKIKFTPKQIAQFETIRVPGMNNSGGNRYRKNGVQAQQHQIQEAKRKEELRIAEEKETKKINEIKEKLPNSEYALINKKESNSKNFIYRNAYVQVVKCGTFEECENELQALNKKNNKYSIVSASKIKY